MDVYKLTDAYDQTLNNTQWGENRTHNADGNHTALGNNQWLHFYFDPYLAAVLGPGQVGFVPANLWHAKAEDKTLLEFQVKGGCTNLTTISRTKLPSITDEQLLRFAATVALKAEDYPTRREWLEKLAEGQPLHPFGNNLHAAPFSPTYYLASLSERPIDSAKPQALRRPCSWVVATAQNYADKKGLPEFDLIALAHNFFGKGA